MKPNHPTATQHPTTAPEMAEALADMTQIIEYMRAHVRPDDREEALIANARAILARINGEGGGV